MHEELKKARKAFEIQDFEKEEEDEF